MSDTIPLALIAVGPQRTGSTWLDETLRRHPDLTLPEHVKETFFFDRHWERGLGDYRRHFRDARGASANWAEVAPTYFDAPEAPERIVSVAPEVRAFIPLRDPVERAVSLYRHHRAKGRVSADFWEASGEIPSIVGAGDYAEHIARWISVLGRERVLVVTMEQMLSDSTLQRLTDWAVLAPLAAAPEAEEPVNASGAPRFPVAARVAAKAVTALHAARLHRVVAAGKRLGLNRVYRGGSVPEVAPDVRQRLTERYAPHVAFVEDLIGQRTGWGEAPESL